MVQGQYYPLYVLVPQNPLKQNICRYNLSHTLIPFELQGEVYSISKVFRSVSAADAIVTSMGLWQLALL